MSRYDFSSITTLQEANARLAVLIAAAAKNINEAEDLADAFGLEFDLPTGSSQVDGTYVGAGEGKFERTEDRNGEPFWVPIWWLRMGREC
jgi:hypothetical protein